MFRNSQKSNEADQISHQCLRLSVSVIGGELDELIVKDRREPQLDVSHLDARTVYSELPSSRSHDSASSLPHLISRTRQIRIHLRFDIRSMHYRRVP